MSGKLTQLTMFPDVEKDRLAFEYDQEREQIQRTYAHNMALLQLRYAEDLEGLNRQYRTDLVGLDKARWELLTLIATHLDQLDEVRQVIEEMARRVDARKAKEQPGSGQDQRSSVRNSHGSPDPGPVQDQAVLWPQIELPWEQQWKDR